MTGAVVIPVRQRTDAWLEARERGLGGSDAGPALGLSRWKSPVQLWAEKLGLVPGPAETVAMRIGSELEPLIARLYTEATGIPLRRATMLRQHREHPWMLASIDRVAQGSRRLVELKFSSRATDYGEPGTDEVPDEVLAQVIHQMAVMDAPEADVVLLTPLRPVVSIFPIRRDREAEALVIERERAFWRHVEERTEPDIDGSAETAAVLRAIYPADFGTVLDATAELAGLVDELAAARAAKKAAAEAEGLAANRLLAAIGDASGIAGLLAAKKNRDTERVDWPGVARDLRALLEGKVPTEELEFIKAAHTETAPGARPLRLLSAKGE